MTMTAVLTAPIVKSNQELIKEQIAAILALELAYQKDVTRAPGDDTGDRLDTFWNGSNGLNLFIDRGLALDESELNGITVNHVSEQFEPGSVLKKLVTARYAVCVIVRAKAIDATQSLPAVPGDADAAKTAQRISKMCRAILMAGAYTTLGFSAGTIVSKVAVGEINADTPREENADYATACVINVDVTYMEPEIMATPVTLERLSTTFGTNGRYLFIKVYSGDPYPPVPEEPEE